MEILLGYLLLGALVGMLAGMLGIGGGLIIIPVLSWGFARQGLPSDIIMPMAIGSSLATIMFTSLSAAYTHQRHGAIEWRLVFSLAPGLVLGGLLGAWIIGLVPGQFLRSLFGLYAILAAVSIAIDKLPAARYNMPSGPGLVLAGGVIGTISTLVGIGGGTMMVPFLSACKLPFPKAVAVSAACGFPIAVAGGLGLLLGGLSQPQLPAYTSGYLYWPAILGIIPTSLLFARWGARLPHVLPIKRLKQLFAVVLALVGLAMMT